MIATELQRRGYQIHMLSLQCGDNPFLELSDGIDANQRFCARRSLFVA